MFSSIVLHWFYLFSCSWVSCYLTASCLVHVVAHKAPTGCLHPSLSAAATLASAQDPHPLSSLSFSTVLLHFVFSLPLFPLPPGVQERGVCYNRCFGFFWGYEFPSSAFYFLAQWSHVRWERNVTKSNNLNMLFWNVDYMNDQRMILLTCCNCDST